MRKYLARSVMVMVAAAAIVVTAELPAAAATYSDCPFGTACVYTDSVSGDGRGAQGVIPFSGFGDGNCHLLNSTFNNKVSAVINLYLNGHSLVLYDNSNCTSSASHPFLDVAAGNAYEMGTDSPQHYMNDLASSFRIL